jgi:hypothetical protein
MYQIYYNSKFNFYFTDKADRKLKTQYTTYGSPYNDKKAANKKAQELNDEIRKNN